MRDLLTVVVLAKNSERTLGLCLHSLLPLGATMLVVDAGSTDRTAQVARELGAEVVYHPFADFASQRNWALGLVRTPWVLFVDSDEEVTVHLAEEIQEAVRATEVAGWWIPRKNIILGRWVKYAGWYPDYQLRLFRVDRGRFDERRPVHELVQLDGRTGKLSSLLVHRNYDSLRQLVAKQRFYAVLAARTLHYSGYRPRLRSLLGMPPREFWRRYVTLKGYKEGLVGLVLASVMAWAEFLTHMYLLRGHGRH